MTRTASSLSLDYSHVPHKIGTIRIPRWPRFGLARRFFEAIEAGVKAHSEAHLVAMGTGRTTREASQGKDDY
jgi:hypothetical protein